jgi:hypothetical protein
VDQRRDAMSDVEKKTGAPAKAEVQSGVLVHFTAEELATLQQLAKGQHVTVERFIHHCVFHPPLARQPDRDDTPVEALTLNMRGRGKLPPI